MLTYRISSSTAAAIAVAMPEISRMVPLMSPIALTQLPVADWLLVEADGPAAMPAFAEFLKRGEPLCGRLLQDKLDALFADKASTVQSAVLLPIGDLGMLAIGSLDANRFHPGMGTVFLRLIAEAVSTAVTRYSGKR